jgi:uncharacterized membrane protein required for colicin V production
MFSKYFFDAVIVLIIVLVGVNGFNRGLIISVTSMGVKVIAIFAAVLFHVPLLQFLDSLLSLRQRVSPAVNTLVSEPLIQNTTTTYVLKVISFLAIVFAIYVAASILINVIMKPLLNIKPVAVLDKGAGLLVSCGCIIIFIALICGLTEPFWGFKPIFEATAKSSQSYPLLIEIYGPCIKVINAFFGNIFINPFEAFPTVNSIEI